MLITIPVNPFDDVAVACIKQINFKSNHEKSFCIRSYLIRWSVDYGTESATCHRKSLVGLLNVQYILLPLRSRIERTASPLIKVDRASAWSKEGSHVSTHTTNGSGGGGKRNWKSRGCSGCQQISPINDRRRRDGRRDSDGLVSQSNPNRIQSPRRIVIGATSLRSVDLTQSWSEKGHHVHVDGACCRCDRGERHRPTTRSCTNSECSINRS